MRPHRAWLLLLGPAMTLAQTQAADILGTTGPAASVPPRGVVARSRRPPQKVPGRR